MGLVPNILTNSMGDGLMVEVHALVSLGLIGIRRGPLCGPIGNETL